MIDPAKLKQVKRLDQSKVKYLVVHCTASPPKANLSVIDVERMHIRDRGWATIGYHYLIKRDGTLEEGRPLTHQGAHVNGFNQVSIGVCLVGGISDNKLKSPENNFTIEQFYALEDILIELKKKFPKASIAGHRDFPNVKKDCPCFDAKKWYASLWNEANA